MLTVDVSACGGGVDIRLPCENLPIGETGKFYSGGCLKDFTSDKDLLSKRLKASVAASTPGNTLDDS